MVKYSWLSEDKVKVLKSKEKSLSIIGNEIRLGILFLLLESKQKLSFNEIARKIGIPNNKLAYHISLLKKGNFIENEMRFSDKVVKSFSFYSLSKKGERTMGLIEQI
jgi:DNA-binding HxlR family transcriptional regulator